jgi:hypothetical protein
MVEPPKRNDGERVVARFNGKPIKAGFLMDVVEENESTFHSKYRSGQYDLEVKIDFDIGRGRVKVEEAEGYDNE